ncbi:DUF362 domain-containing protein [Desulfovibrio sp. OttesenSCG-928-M14]|nr:DUF362 domain-containing protein [Desulfovibrio sp. OttesenSCG-928-M14]
MAVSRRAFLKSSTLAVGALALSNMSGGLGTALAAAQEGSRPKAKVFFTKDLSPDGLRKLYAEVNQGITGKTAIKLHTGEPKGPNIIPQEWVRAFMPSAPGSTIVECNVLYSSPRQTTAGHRQTLETNGWTFSPVDIMDADGDVKLPIAGGKWFKELAVGKNIINYDSMLVLTHFKGHTMGGFGGALKNISIGCASGRAGKEQLHREGSQLWSGGPNFMERMVEGGKAVTDYFGPRITYINVLRNMSVDCDCVGTSAAPPIAPDIGILASTDILAIDQASVDMVYALPDAQKRDIVERIESRSGLRQLTYMKELGMGNNEYEIVPVS